MHNIDKKNKIISFSLRPFKQCKSNNNVGFVRSCSVPIGCSLLYYNWTDLFIFINIYSSRMLPLVPDQTSIKVSHINFPNDRR